MTAESGRIGRDKHLIVPYVHLMSRENSNFYKIVVSGYHITSYVVAGCPANRKPLSHNTLRKNPTKCIHALASYCLVGLEAGLRKGQTPKPAFLYNRLVGLMYYPQRFRDRYVHGDDPLPYFVPSLTASTIRSYSVRYVPYHLCLALVFRPPSYQQGATPSACFELSKKKTAAGQACPRKS